MNFMQRLDRYLTTDQLPVPATESLLKNILDDGGKNRILKELNPNVLF